MSAAMRATPSRTGRQPSLSLAIRNRIAPTVQAEQRLSWLLARLTPAERRAFWLAALIIDQAVTLADAVDWWQAKHPEPPTATAVRRTTKKRTPIAKASSKPCRRFNEICTVHQDRWPCRSTQRCGEGNVSR